MVRPALFLLLLAGCAPALDAETSAGRPEFDAIAFEIKSWGRPIDSWEVRSDGRGSHVKMVDGDTSTFRTYALEHREFEIPAADFARLAAMAAALPQPRLSRDDCEERATDLPYGTLRLTREGQEEAVSFDVGCLDAPYREFVGQLRAMDAAVTEWAEKSVPVRTEAIEE